MSLEKISVPSNIGFDHKRAMELANLISVAYNEYEVWDTNPTLQEEDELPPIITGSDEFVDLQTNVLECHVENKNEDNNTNYQKLTQFWTSKKEYHERKNFFFPQWYLFDLFTKNKLIEFANADVMEVLETIGDLGTTEQIFGFITRSQEYPSKIFVVFRGTRENAEWWNNFRPKAKPFLPNVSSDLGKVRNGFNLIYTSKRDNPSLLDSFPKLKENFFFNKIQNLLTASPKHLSIETTINDFFNSNHFDNSSEVFITGHSLGAGLATLAASHIAKIAEKKNINPSIQLYTFASPRVGDEAFARQFDNFNTIKSFRIINSEDLVPSTPLSTTQIVDQDILDGMKASGKTRHKFVKDFLEKLTNGQSKFHYQHIGIPITFTKQTGTIAGNHNLTKTYREALNIE